MTKEKTTKKTTKATTKKPTKAVKTTKKTAKPKTKPEAKTTRRTTKPKAVQPMPKSKAEELCERVGPELRAQTVSLANAVLTMQEKIEQQIPIYKSEPLSQKVTLGTGEEVQRVNPFVQEFRATVRDYASALNNLKEILEENKTEASISPVDSLRNKFKVG